MTLKNREFLGLVRDAALGAISDGEPSVRLHGPWLQMHFGEFPQHYEVWVRSQAGLIELGLHFEGDKEDNYRRIAVVADAMADVASFLGPQVEVEEWTERWTRVHETVDARALTEDLAIELGLRLAKYIEVLEPIVRPLGPIRPPVAARAGRSRRPRGSRSVRT